MKPVITQPVKFRWEEWIDLDILVPQADVLRLEDFSVGRLAADDDIQLVHRFHHSPRWKALLWPHESPEVAVCHATNVLKCQPFLFHFSVTGWMTHDSYFAFIRWKKEPHDRVRCSFRNQLRCLLNITINNRNHQTLLDILLAHRLAGRKRPRPLTCKAAW